MLNASIPAFSAAPVSAASCWPPPRGFFLDRHDGAAHGVDFVINLESTCIAVPPGPLISAATRDVLSTEQVAKLLDGRQAALLIEADHMASHGVEPKARDNRKRVRRFQLFPIETNQPPALHNAEIPKQIRARRRHQSPPDELPRLHNDRGSSFARYAMRALTRSSRFILCDSRKYAVTSGRPKLTRSAASNYGTRSLEPREPLAARIGKRFGRV